MRNNRAAVSWANKVSLMLLLAVRAHLLHFNVLHQCQHCFMARNHCILGHVNVMADDAAGHMWCWGLPDDQQLLTHINSNIPSRSPAGECCTYCPQAMAS